MAEENDRWQWQEPGKAWKGVGLYHVTLTIPSREPLLGRLEIPDDDPAQARVERTALGDALVDALLEVPHFHPEVKILHFCIMPDHLHSVWYVRHAMPKGIAETVRGFWQGIKKLGRAHTFLTSYSYSSSSPSSLSSSLSSLSSSSHSSSSIVPNDIRENIQEEPGRLSCLMPEDKNLLCSTSGSLLRQLGDNSYYALSPVFTRMPFIRPMSKRRQLPATIRYIDMNPQRLATKRLMPGFFRVQEGIEISGRIYAGVGNMALLLSERFMPVHVRAVWVEDAERHGYDKPLRDYMNSCVLEARKGAVMVSPFISKQEKEVMGVLLDEGLPFIYIIDNGFRDYYKPQDSLFDAVARKQVLILSPWKYDAGKKHVTRADCVAMNKMAEEIYQTLLL